MNSVYIILSAFDYSGESDLIPIACFSNLERAESAFKLLVDIERSADGIPVPEPYIEEKSFAEPAYFNACKTIHFYKIRSNDGTHISMISLVAINLKEMKKL